jgi:hypothetical protein
MLMPEHRQALSVVHHFIAAFVINKMDKLKTIFYFGLISFVLTDCKEQTWHKQQKISAVNTVQFKTTFKHCAYSDISRLCKCSAEYDLKDSFKFKRINDQFYISTTGHLYEKTIATKEVQGQDTLVDVTYFNGCFSQEVDPLTFEPLDGWYAKDKNYVYYYKPVSGGMQVSKIDTADTRTFKLLTGHYKYAMDKSFFYDEAQIIEGFIQSKSKLKLDKKGRVIEMTCDNKTYKFEIVE